MKLLIQEIKLVFLFCWAGHWGAPLPALCWCVWHVTVTAWVRWVTQCTEQWAMGDSLSDRLLQDLIHGYQDLAEDIGCLPILRWHAEDVDRAPTNESALDISKTFQPQILQKKNFNWNAFRKQTKSFSQPFDFCIIFILTFENSVSKFHSSTSIPWEFKGLKALNV